MLTLTFKTFKSLTMVLICEVQRFLYEEKKPITQRVAFGFQREFNRFVLIFEGFNQLRLRKNSITKDGKNILFVFRFITGPNIPAGTTLPRTDIFHLTDITATIMDIAGIRQGSIFIIK